MKFILERLDGELYAYTEDNKHYNKLLPQRTSRRLTLKDLADECNLATFSDDFHLVLNFDIKKANDGT